MPLWNERKTVKREKAGRSKNSLLNRFDMEQTKKIENSLKDAGEKQEPGKEKLRYFSKA